jgi:hypothetical protein
MPQALRRRLGVVAMGWKVAGQPTVRTQRDTWVVRVDGIDTEAGKLRPKRIGTCAEGRANRDIAAELRVHPTTVAKWRRRFAPGALRFVGHRVPASRYPVPGTSGRHSPGLSVAT